METGGPREARWIAAEPRRGLAADTLDRIVRLAVGDARVLEIEALTGGLRNANFRIRVNRPPGQVVLRMYEHDPSLCRKELDVFRLIGGSVPVPEILYAEPQGLDGLPPFTVARYIEGISFLALKRSGDREALAQAAFSAGEALAAIGRFRFERSGWLSAGLEVTAPLLEGSDPAPRFIDQCLATARLQRRMPEDLRARVHERAWETAPRFAELDAASCLVHGDFSRRNLLVESTGGKWRVAAVLDWEFAISASPLNDVGNFLRYERAQHPLAEPHFSQGYRTGGGELPEDWQTLIKRIDLVALCSSLAEESLPDDAAVEIVELIRATVEDRDARA